MDHDFYGIRSSTTDLNILQPIRFTLSLNNAADITKPIGGMRLAFKCLNNLAYYKLINWDLKK